MVPWKPDLLQSSSILIGSSPLPDGWCKGGPVFVKSQSLESVLYAVRKVGVIEPKFGCATSNTELGEPGDIWNAQTANGLPYSHRFHCD